MNCELPDVQAGFKKGRGTRDQIANISWIIKKAREFQINMSSTLLTMPKPLTVWITTNCGNFLKRWKPDHLTWILSLLTTESYFEFWYLSLKKKMYSHSVLGTLRYTERLMFSQNYPSTESSAGFNKYYVEKQFKCAWEILQGKPVF